MTRIFKYVLVPGTNAINAVIVNALSVAWEGDDLVLWGEVIVNQSKEITVYQTHIAVLMTGEEPPALTQRGRPCFIGTAMHPTLLNGAPFVVHVYQFFP